MDHLKENVNLPLLYEVRKDALEKTKGVECGERLFAMMYHMESLLWAARKEGLLALEQTAKEIPSESTFYQDIQLVVSYVCDGSPAEDVTEILTARYWIKGLQGEDALLYFMMIMSVLRIQDGVSPYLLEDLLTSCISDENAERYLEYKKQHKLMKVEQTPTERLLKSAPDLGEGGILVVKELLEKKIAHADEKQLKKVIKEAERSDLILSLRGLSISAKEKLFSIMSADKADEYAQDCEYMGPVRKIDIMGALAELLAVFEEIGIDG